MTVKYRWNLSVDPTESSTIAPYLSTTCAGLNVGVPDKAGTPDPVGQVQAYITKVYSDLFGRTPDPSGLATWTNLLRSGTPYTAVANAITSSDEYRSGMIRATYRTYLDREPDAAGLAFWLSWMQRGMRIEQMQAGFISSDEYYNLGGGTARDWIVRLYDKVLHRTPAEPEIAFWLGQLAAGPTRGDVASGFLFSTEHLTEVVDGYYQSLLGRHIDPVGQQWWVTAIQAGALDEQIIAGIIASDEYRSTL